MKNILKIGAFILVVIWLLGKCSDCGSGSSVEALYGTYTATDDHGNKIKIHLKSESDNEWRKYGYDYSDNLVFTDSRGRIRDMDFQTIKWTWNLDEGYVKVYYNSYERWVIDVIDEKIYDSWGEYLDDRNGFSYRFSD